MGVMSVRELNANVSSAIARAEAGEIIEITKNNRTVAELRPKRHARDAAWTAASQKVDEIMRRGFNLGGTPATIEDRYGDVDL